MIKLIILGIFLEIIFVRYLIATFWKWGWDGGRQSIFFGRGF